MNEFFSLNLTHITNLKAPEHQAPVDESIEGGSSSPPPQYKYSLQFNVTFYNPATSFFGRTYRGRQMPLRPV